MSLDLDSVFDHTPGLLFIADANGKLLRHSKALGDRFAARLQDPSLMNLVDTGERATIEAFLTEMFAESPDPDTGCAREDFRLALRGLMRFYTGPSGRVFAQLVGEAQFDPEVAAELRDRLVGSRRTLVRAIWELAAHPGAGDLGPRGHPRRAAPRHRSRGRDRPRFRAGDVPTGRRARAAGRRGRRRDRRRSPARPGPLTAELSD